MIENITPRIFATWQEREAYELGRRAAASYGYITQSEILGEIGGRMIKLMDEVECTRVLARAYLAGREDYLANS